ncbi:hypothetical protein HYDPIDRAFT_117734 [Hydnomerulius pinastri MD-312]|uniref:Uncharacterized protein n=1 Tax=Hydnomerulius pinastri MD-312 TaxID=994086 RepID=A0A0C9W259_9AGAM|nr:hypothetical protein HYDPIDRAFT_117734 [Hydnomerulius pinastri MD-312]
MASESTDRRTVVIPIDLGAAAKYDQSVFPLSSYRNRDSLGRGDFLLDATLEEMLKISAMGTDLSQNTDFFIATKARYDELMSKKETLESRPRTFSPFKAYANYRAVRLFYVASKNLYLRTRSTSEKMRRSLNRNLLSVPSEDVAPVGGGLPSDANICGIAVALDGPLDEETMRTITDAANTIASCADPFADNPFIDQLSSVAESMLSDSDLTSVNAVNTASSGVAAANRLSSASTSSQASDTTSPGSAASIQNFFIFKNSVMAPNSNVNGATLNQGGSQNSGSVNHLLSPSAPPEST